MVCCSVRAESVLSQVGLVLTMQRARVSDAGDRVLQCFGRRREEGERAGGREGAGGPGQEGSWASGLVG